MVIRAAQIDRDGLDLSNRRALGSALEAVAVAGSANLVDWFDLEVAGLSAQRVEQGDAKSAAIAAASIVAKETRDQLMRGLDVEYPGYGFAVHKGYITDDQVAAVIEMGGLSPAHRERAMQSVCRVLFLPSRLVRHARVTAPRAVHRQFVLTLRGRDSNPDYLIQRKRPIRPRQGASSQG